MSGITSTIWTRGELKDPFFQLCGLLTHDELADKVSLVCKKWKEWADYPSFWTANQLSQLNVRIFSRYWVEQELKRALPPEMYAQLSFRKIPRKIKMKSALIKASRFYARIKAAGTAVEEEEGLTIVPRPKGLTLNMLNTAYRNRFQMIWVRALQKLGDTKSDGGQFMITSNILEKTRKKSIAIQQALCQQTGGDLPEILDGVFYALMTEQVTAKIGDFSQGSNPFDPDNQDPRQDTYAIQPFSDDLPTYSRSINKVGDFSLIFGGFAPEGLEVPIIHYDSGACGASALRKF